VHAIPAKGIAMPLPPPPRSIGRPRKKLSADALLALVRDRFASIPDPRQLQPAIPLADALMSAFAMFVLKDPSLLAFDGRRNDANLRSIFGLGRIPSDTAMREILDPIDPEHLRPVFDAVFREIQRGKALERFKFLGGYLLSLDGTGSSGRPTRRSATENHGGPAADVGAEFDRKARTGSSRADSHCLGRGTRWPQRSRRSGGRHAVCRPDCGSPSRSRGRRLSPPWPTMRRRSSRSTGHHGRRVIPWALIRRGRADGRDPPRPSS
jgi:hypothetical protein